MMAYLVIRDKRFKLLVFPVDKFGKKILLYRSSCA